MVQKRTKEEYFGGGFNILAIKLHRSHKTLRIIRSIFWKVLNRNIEVGTLKKIKNKKNPNLGTLSNCTNLRKIQKMVNFTHFGSKTNHISGFITLYLCKNAIVIVYIYTIIVVLYQIIIFSLSSLCLFRSLLSFIP